MFRRSLLAILLLASVAEARIDRIWTSTESNVNHLECASNDSLDASECPTIPWQVASSAPSCTEDGEAYWHSSNDQLNVCDGSSFVTFHGGAHTTDTGPSPDCSGSLTYQDGDANCDTYTLSGNTTKLATVSGSQTDGNCVESDANGNFVDSGAACGGGGGSPAGSDTEVQFNNAGSFGADAGFTHVHPQVTVSDGVADASSDTASVRVYQVEGSLGSPETIEDDELAGDFRIGAYNGSAIQTVGLIRGIASENHSSGNMGTELTLWNVDTGSGTAAQKVTVGDILTLDSEISVWPNQGGISAAGSVWTWNPSSAWTLSGTFQTINIDGDITLGSTNVAGNFYSAVRAQTRFESTSSAGFLLGGTIQLFWNNTVRDITTCCNALGSGTIQSMRTILDQSEVDNSSTGTPTNGVEHVSLDDNSLLRNSGSGAITSDFMRTIHSRPRVIENLGTATVTERSALYIDDITVTGTPVITANYGVVINNLSQGSQNTGFFNASNTVTPADTVTSLSAGTQIPHDRSLEEVVTASGDVTLTATDVLTDGQDGECITIINADSTDSVTLPHGNNLALFGDADQTLDPDEGVTLCYTADVGDWVQISGPPQAGGGGGSTVTSDSTSSCAASLSGTTETTVATLADYDNTGASTILSAGASITAAGGTREFTFRLKIEGSTVETWNEGATSGESVAVTIPWIDTTSASARTVTLTAQASGSGTHTVVGCGITRITHD